MLWWEWGGCLCLCLKLSSWLFHIRSHRDGCSESVSHNNESIRKEASRTRPIPWIDLPPPASRPTPPSGSLSAPRPTAASVFPSAPRQTISSNTLSALRRTPSRDPPSAPRPTPSRDPPSAPRPTPPSGPPSAPRPTLPVVLRRLQGRHLPLNLHRLPGWHLLVNFCRLPGQRLLVVLRLLPGQQPPVISPHLHPPSLIWNLLLLVWCSYCVPCVSSLPVVCVLEFDFWFFLCLIWTLIFVCTLFSCFIATPVVGPWTDFCLSLLVFVWIHL